MPTGTVKFFNAARGFGFIETESMEDDVFFHVDDIDGPEPREGEQLEFEIQKAPRGPRAEQVRVL